MLCCRNTNRKIVGEKEQYFHRSLNTHIFFLKRCNICIEIGALHHGKREVHLVYYQQQFSCLTISFLWYWGHNLLFLQFKACWHHLIWGDVWHSYFFDLNKLVLDLWDHFPAEWLSFRHKLPANGAPLVYSACFSH